MLKRLIIVAAALALVFVFVPTSSAGESGLPTNCLNVDRPGELEECLDVLDAPGGDLVPSECREFLTGGGLPLPVLGDFQNPTGELLDCLNAITGLGDEGGQSYDAGLGYDEGYGYDLGYDIGYDEGVPEGGVDSGFGPTGSDAAGAPLAARGAALLALVGVLATGLLIMRRRHGS